MKLMQHIPASQKKQIDRSNKFKAVGIARQVLVEKYMTAGMSLTQIATAKVNGKKLGTMKTITRDMDIIRSRWLDRDPEWFNRARLARIEAETRLTAQLVRLNKLILNTQAGQQGNEVDDSFIRSMAILESRLTDVITKLYEINSDFDPEQYLDSKIKARYEAIKTETPSTS